MKTDKITLDEAQEAFKNFPNGETALNLGWVALEYNVAEMIGNEEFNSIVKSILEYWGRKNKENIS